MGDREARSEHAVDDATLVASTLGGDHSAYETLIRRHFQAAVVAVVAGTLVVQAPNESGVAEPRPPSVSSALGVDPTIATWIRHANALPSAAEVVAAVRDLP